MVGKKMRNICTFKFSMLTVYGPRRKKTCLRGFANNKGADQPVHLRSLICASVR